MPNDDDFDKLLHFVVEHISIPKSLYQRAADRHRSLGEHLKREGSAIAQFDPDIRPQGSFRFGTVNRPLDENDEYDLDNVCVLKKLGKSNLTQQQLKHLYGEEIKAYTREHGMIAPVEEHNRCWRLRYADDVSFHLDTLPCVPEDAAAIQRLKDAGVVEELANRVVAITDRRHPKYGELTFTWPSSNPRGFARMFEQRAALGRLKVFGQNTVRATVEDVPPYEWKTPLQASIQILKRHRDVMFRKSSDLAPISMIITNLAARSYEGEGRIAEALANIIERMPTFVRSDWPKVPNPADPFEDYADKWRLNPKLEKSFWQWYVAVKSDFASIAAAITGQNLGRKVEDLFQVTLTGAELRSLQPRAPAIISAAPALVIPSAPKPWGINV